MNARLIALYDRELQYLREKAAEFAHYRPNTASELGLSQGHGKAQDSHVERLLEGVACLAARVHERLESAFPQIGQSLAETIYPHLICPFPACGIVEFKPGRNLAEDYLVPRNSQLTVRVVSDKDRQISSPETDCVFRTAQPVTLLPIELKEAAYAGSRPDFPGWNSDVVSSLRFRLKHRDGQPLSDLNGMSALTFYIRGLGGAVLAARVYELLVRSAVTGGVIKTNDGRLFPVPGLRVEPVGFSDEEALLPIQGVCFQGYRLLREFFAFPARFMFFRLSGLGEALRQCAAPEVDIFLGFPDRDPELESQVSERLFALYCTPVINLFRGSAIVPLTRGLGEFEIVRETGRRLDHEVYQVLSVVGNQVGKPSVQEFLPFFHPPRRDGDARAYFTVRRQYRSLTPEELEHKSIPDYLGSEVYLSLVDPQKPPFSSGLSSVTAEVLYTNRHLPSRILPGSPVFPPVACPAAVLFLAERAKPQAAVLEGDLVWRIISHLSTNYFSLLGGEPDGKERDACVLRELLRVYSDSLRQSEHKASAQAVDRWINTLETVNSRPIWRLHSERGATALVRGLEVTLELKEAPLEEVGLFLFGSVLERFFSRFVSINSFIEMVLRGDRRGEIKRWQMRIGQRMTL